MKMYVYLKDGKIVSDSLIPLSLEPSPDSCVEIEYDETQNCFHLELEESGNPKITYGVTSVEPS